MKQFIYIIALCCCLSACKDKPTEAPKPVLPEGDFQVEATLSEGNKLTVAWSSPKDLEGGAALTYTVYLGDKALGETKENAISANISGNRFVNGRVITTDAAGRTYMKVFLIKGDGRDLVYIPDTLFEKVLIMHKIDRDHVVNNEMRLIDAVNVDSVFHLNYSAKNHIGIEAFENLEFFVTAEGPLEELDMSKNEKLRILYCWHNQIQRIYLDKSLALEDLNFQDNSALVQLNVSKCINLKQLSFVYTPNLKTICVADVEKAKVKNGWKKPETAVYVKCN